MNRLMWLAIVAAALVIPSVVSGGTLEAWGKIKVMTRGGGLPAGIPDGVTLRLHNSQYDVTISSGSDAFVNAFRTGKFSFQNVPTEVSLDFDITAMSVTGDTRTFHASYVFGELSALQKLQFNAKKSAGNMGVFQIDLATGEIVILE